MPPQRESTRREFSLLLAFVAIYAVGFGSISSGGELLRWWNNGFWSVAALATAWRCLRTARCLARDYQAFWRHFAAACAAWFVGMVIWSWYELALQRVVPFPALSDVGFLLFAPLCVLGMIYIRKDPLTRAVTLKELSDFGIIFCATIISALFLLSAPLSELSADFIEKLVAVAYPVLYISAFLYAVYVFMTLSVAAYRRTLVLLATSLGLSAYTNTLYARALLDGSYSAGHYLDAFWILAFAAIYAAGLLAAREWCAAGRGPEGGERRPRWTMLGADAFLPPASLVAVVFIGIAHHHDIDEASQRLILLVAGVMAVILLLREWAVRRLELEMRERMEQGRAYLQQLIDSTSEGMYGLDGKARCTFANAACLRLLGYDSAGQLVGRHIHQLIHHTRGDGRPYPESDCPVCRTLQTHEAVFLESETFWRRDGTPLPVRVWANPIRDGSGTVASFHDMSEQLETQRRISRSETQLEGVLDAIQDTYIRTRLDGRIEMISKSCESLLGYPQDELRGRNIVEFYADPSDRHAFLEKLRGQEGVVRGFELRFLHRDGREVWAAVSARLLRDEHGKAVGIEGTARDVTERIVAGAEMAKLSSALQQTADAVIITDARGAVEYVNSAFESMTGFKAEEVLGRTPSLLKSGRHEEKFYTGLWQRIRGGEPFVDVFVNRRKDESLYYEAKTITPLKNGRGEITHFISTGKDITSQMETQQRLQFLAQHDSLTELPNRSLFLDRVAQSLARAERRGRRLAVLFLDLDRFKTINDSLGHDVGDELLGQIAGRLLGVLREGDTVARFGGDEFVLLLDDLASDEDASQVAQKLLLALKDPFHLDQLELHVSASIGIGLYPTDGKDPQVLLKNADAAMYQAKELGRNTFKFYSEDLGRRALRRLTLDNHLRHALEREEFRLHYQPLVDMRSGAVIGAEALLRWQHGSEGLISPAEFIPVLEETGLITSVGNWVLETACGALQSWQTDDDFLLSVNLSPLQLMGTRLAEQIEATLRATKVDPKRLQVEVTENVFLQNAPVTKDNIAALHALGVSLAIDDFGTGWSSLSYLKRFPISTLKIDRSFVRDLETDPSDAALTAAIVAMGNSLELKCIAEGVERPEQVAFLLEQGCTHAQGFLYSAAVPVDEFARLLAAGNFDPRR